MATLVPFDDYEKTARQAWTDRRSPSSVRELTSTVEASTYDLVEILAGAEAERSVNESGTQPEEILDELGDGFAALSFSDADKLCESDVLGCVSGNDPYVVHLDRGDLSHPSVDSWGERFVTLHEFAHVLHFTNPEATEAALDAFGDDGEFMADCYALDAMDAWSLDRRVWVSAYQYWDTSYGYGTICNQEQRRVIRDWVDQSGVGYRTVSQ